VSAAILRPQGVLGAVEAMSLRDNFKRVLETGGDGVIVDLTGVQELSAAGLAAVTNLVRQGRRIGIPVRVLPPEQGSEAAVVIDQADLRRFLAPGGLWDTEPTRQIGSAEPSSCGRLQRGRWLRHRLESLRRGMADAKDRFPAAAALWPPKTTVDDRNRHYSPPMRLNPARES
jgi:anti-anti-sigma regulatory factor